jgi:hypothetical protein
MTIQLTHGYFRFVIESPQKVIFKLYGNLRSFLTLRQLSDDEDILKFATQSMKILKVLTLWGSRGSSLTTASGLKVWGYIAAADMQGELVFASKRESDP